VLTGRHGAHVADAGRTTRDALLRIVDRVFRRGEARPAAVALRDAEPGNCWPISGSGGRAPLGMVDPARQACRARHQPRFLADAGAAVPRANWRSRRHPCLRRSGKALPTCSALSRAG
jgi:hypothetical protein